MVGGDGCVCEPHEPASSSTRLEEVGSIRRVSAGSAWGGSIRDSLDRDVHTDARVTILVLRLAVTLCSVGSVQFSRCYSCYAASRVESSARASRCLVDLCSAVVVAAEWRTDR